MAKPKHTHTHIHIYTHIIHRNAYTHTRASALTKTKMSKLSPINVAEDTRSPDEADVDTNGAQYAAENQRHSAEIV